jgi:PAS domain S-box-containing protein
MCGLLAARPFHVDNGPRVHALIVGLLLSAVALAAMMAWRIVELRRELAVRNKMITAAGLSIVITDATVPRNPVLSINPAFRLLTGYTDDEILGQSLAVLHGPRTDRGVIEKLAMAAQDRRHCRVLVEHHRKDGTPFWNELALAPLKNKRGEVTRYLWIMSDATPREQADASLKASHDELQSVVEAAPTGILSMRHDGTISLVNGQVEQMFGYSRHELLGRPVEILLPERLRSVHVERREVFATSPGPRPLEAGRTFTGRRKDGSEFPVEIALSPLPSSSGVSVLATIIDITQRQTIDTALRESQERLELAVAAGRVGIFEQDHQTDEVYWSPTLRVLCGIGPDTPASFQRYLDLVPDEDRPMLLTAIRASHDPAGEGILVAEHRLVTPAGESKYVAVQARTTFDRPDATAAKPTRTIGTVVDITDRKRAEVYQRDSSKMEAIGTLAGGIAHEFNNSLTAVLGFSELALGLIPSASKAHRHIEQVVAAGRKSRELVHQLLTFSQQHDHVKRPLSLHSLLKEALKLLRPTMPSWIELRERIAPTTRPISADATQMHQLILNLVENALHAMRQSGGVLEIRLRDEEIAADQEHTSGRLPAGHYACLAVTDSGEGMDPEVAARIFDPFFTTKPGEGRGMGLSVVHGIVTAHGGTVLVETAAGQGTTVSIYLPALPPRTAAAPASGTALPRGHERILFVDDEEALAAFGGEMLESLGYYPIVRKDASEAWEAFQIAPQQFDLLITDLTMPGMNGIALAQECRRLRPDLPVILCAGSDQSLSADEARAQGITEYLMKPVMLHDLAEAIRRVLDARTAVGVVEEAATAALLTEESDALSARR